MRVECEVDQVELSNERGPVDGVQAVCQRCGHRTESYGTGIRSVRRCLVLMRDECPNGEENFYTCPETEKD